GSFAFHQRFCLRKEVGKQFDVMITDRVMAYDRRNEIARNQFGALMQELIKGMLTVGARLAPDNRTGLIGNRVAGTIDGFAVTLHIALLEIRCKPMQVLIVGEDRFR